MLLSYLHGHAHVTYDDIHVIGHSLGAQVAAQAGKSVHGKLARISGK